MSTRKIKHWGKNAGEAFGRTGYKGMKGEHWFAEYYRSKGFKVELYEATRKKQTIGVDAKLITEDGSEFTVDVKNNLKPDNSFYVEMASNGWLFNPKYVNTYVSHVNPNTGVIATYKRERMQMFVENNYWDYRGEILRLNKEDPNLNFIKWTFTKTDP